MLQDDTWIGNNEIFELFKVYCMFKVGIEYFLTFKSRYESDEFLIFFLRLDIIRHECDILGGPELIPPSTVSSWTK